jgi:hypothetical protein
MVPGALATVTPLGASPERGRIWASIPAGNRNAGGTIRPAPSSISRSIAARRSAPAERWRVRALYLGRGKAHDLDFHAFGRFHSAASALTVGRWSAMRPASRDATSSLEGRPILDAGGGSGTVLLAAEGADGGRTSLPRSSRSPSGIDGVGDQVFRLGSHDQRRPLRPGPGRWRMSGLA